jgi:hypothetical protein
MSDWKTTVAGIASAVFAFVVFAPEHFQQWPILIDLAKFAAAGGIAVLGITAAQTSKKE